MGRANAFGDIFEGQRLASVRCSNCLRAGASSAEPFIVEEVKLAAHAQENGWLAPLSNWLTGTTTPSSVELGEVLRESTESPAPEGYKCPNVNCGKIGSSSRTSRFLRLPAVLLLHVNRAQPDGGRCELALDF